MATQFEITSQNPSEFLSMTSYTLKEFEALLPAFEEELLHSKQTLEGKERENILIIATLLYLLQPISSFLFLFIKNTIHFNRYKTFFLAFLNRKRMSGSIFSARSSNQS